MAWPSAWQSQSLGDNFKSSLLHTTATPPPTFHQRRSHFSLGRRLSILQLCVSASEHNTHTQTQCFPFMSVQFDTSAVIHNIVTCEFRPPSRTVGTSNGMTQDLNSAIVAGISFNTHIHFLPPSSPSSLVSILKRG